MWFILHNKVAFLDRDGVINEKAGMHDYIKSWKEFHFLPDVDKAIRKLNRCGFKIIIVTNQRGIARGIMNVDVLNDIHRRMCIVLENQSAIIEKIFVCPHDIDECHCRKPEIGLFLQAEKEYKIDKEKSFMIGDSRTDIQAGKKYGVKTIAINKESFGADYFCDSLLEAATYICGGE